MTTVSDLDRLSDIESRLSYWRPRCQYVYWRGNHERERDCQDYESRHPKKHIGHQHDHDFIYDPDEDFSPQADVRWLMDFLRERRQVLR